MKSRINAFPKRVLPLALLAAVAAISMATGLASAQEGHGEADRIIGSWRVTVNVTDPPGVPSFPVLMTFHSDGTLMQSRPYYIPAFGVMETAHHGGWKRIDGDQIAATTLSLAQGAPGNAALNGEFFGTEKVNFKPMIDTGGDSFTALWTSTVYDPGGNPIVQGSGKLSGDRIRVEP